jgi:hypothetical protein
MRASVTGLLMSIPFLSSIHRRGLASVRSRRSGRCLMGSDEDRPANLGKRSHRVVGCPRICGLTESIVPAKGLRCGRGPGVRGSPPCRFVYPPIAYSYAADVARPVRLKASPERSIRCSTTASLRARATFALRMPARFATASAHLFRAEPLTGRVSITFAAS